MANQHSPRLVNMTVMLKKAQNHIYEHSDVAMVMGMKKGPGIPVEKVVVQLARDLVEFPEGDPDGNPVPIRLVSSTTTMNADAARKLAEAILSQLEGD